MNRLSWLAICIILGLLYPFQSTSQAAPIRQTPQLPNGFILPFAVGQTWRFTGGPHDYNSGLQNCTPNVNNCPPQSAWSSVDFAPNDGRSGCRDTPNHWIVAAESGTVQHVGNHEISIEHAGGWWTRYAHVTNKQVKVGDWVMRGWRLGNPSCIGLVAGALGAGNHVHFAIAYGGRTNYVPIAGLSLSGWVVQNGTLHYHGTLTRNGEVRGRTSSIYADDVLPPPLTPTLLQPTANAQLTPPFAVNIQNAHSYRQGHIDYNVRIATDPNATQIVYEYAQVNNGQWSLSPQLQVNPNLPNGDYYLCIMQGDGQLGSPCQETTIPIRIVGSDIVTLPPSLDDVTAIPPNIPDDVTPVPSHNPTVAQDVYLSMNLNSIQAVPNDILTLSLNMSSDGLTTIWAYQAICGFDAALLGSPIITLGGLFNPEVAIPQVSDGQIALAITQTHLDEPVVATGTVSMVNFTALAVGQGSIVCDIGLYDRERQILFDTTALTLGYTITESAIVEESGSITGEVLFWEGLRREIISIEIYASDDLQLFDTQFISNDQSIYEFINVPAGSYWIVVDAVGCVARRIEVLVTANEPLNVMPTLLTPGDVNNDATVDIQDLVQLSSQYLNTATEYIEEDLDQNGLIDIQDLIMLGETFRQTIPLQDGLALPAAAQW